MYVFSPVQSCPTLCNPTDCSMPGFPVHHQLPEPAQTHVPFTHLRTSFLKMSIDSAVMIKNIYMNFFVTMHAQTFEKYKY